MQVTVPQNISDISLLASLLKGMRPMMASIFFSSVVAFAVVGH